MNKVKLAGEVTRDPKTGDGAAGPYTFFSLRTKEDKPTIIDVAAFGEQAGEAGRLREGDAVEVTGRLGVKEDKKLSEKAGRKVWLMQVVAETVSGGDAF